VIGRCGSDQGCSRTATIEAVNVYLASSIETIVPRVCFISQKNEHFSRLVFLRTATAMLFVSTTSGALAIMNETALEHGDDRFLAIAALSCIVEGGG